MTRRRYDTEMLVGEFRRERRNAVLLSLTAAGLLVFLVVYFTRMRGEAVPTVPANVDTRPVPLAPPEVKPAPPAVAAPAEPPPPAAEPTLIVALSRPGPLWVDGKLVGPKVREHTVTLSPGSHVLKTKFGKKFVQENVSLEAGKSYRMVFDAKKKKAELVASAPAK